MSDGVSVNEAEENRQESEREEAIAAAQPQMSAGAQLAALREERGWTVEQVANQLNLASRQIQALEADNYAALPGMVIVRGFIRTYAKLLRVDSAPILAAIASDKAEPDTVLQDRGSLSTAFSESRVSSGKSGASSSKLVMAGVALAIVVVLGFAAERMGWIPVKEQQSQTEEKPVTVEVPETQLSAVGTTSEEARTLPAGEHVQQAAAAEKTASAPAVAEPAADNVAVSPPVSPDSKNALVFQMKEDSWVEIRRDDDSILVSRLFKAGTTEVFDITSPVAMVIGNAAGVSVKLRGKPLDVSGNSSNVARLNLK
ncbi:MAG TPA: RodZ domain-containing protein [Oxalicibacterium sp.]|uniref:helix-turn-helix domain-containing protein n=1 Tax=Oxalicibacterium sp. TaxID=2766525 RepID=UPI002C12E260|nr:RodZ domain-containing protein [Oxalicibacterium sp.]HWU97724.1 RodZ domain-containing protein [Oxalicibacterium sp.]